MAQITVTFDSFEDMKEFAEKFLGTEKVPVSLGEKEVPAQTQSIPVTPVAPVMPITPVQSAPVTPVAQPAPSHTRTDNSRRADSSGHTGTAGNVSSADNGAYIFAGRVGKRSHDADG